MSEVAGDFEIHITAYEQHADKLAALAAERGVKFLHIVLDRGSYPSQPMLTLTGRGSLAEQHATVQRWKHELRAANIYPCRSKIEAAPWCTGVPRSDQEAAAEPAGRYFEHHVKLLLPALSVADLVKSSAPARRPGTPRRPPGRHPADPGRRRAAGGRDHRVGDLDVRAGRWATAARPVQRAGGAGRPRAARHRLR